MGILCPGCLSEGRPCQVYPAGHRLSRVVCLMPVTLASISMAIPNTKHLTRKREAELPRGGQGDARCRMLDQEINGMFAAGQGCHEGSQSCDTSARSHGGSLT